MRQQRHFRKSRQDDVPPTTRVMGRERTRNRQSSTGFMKLFKTSPIEVRVNGGVHEANRTENAERHRSILLANTATRDKCMLREAVANEWPLRSASPIHMPDEILQPHDDLNVERKSTCRQGMAMRPHSRRVRDLHASENQHELTGTSTHERARLTVV
jgi:hypothetical protein